MRRAQFSVLAVAILVGCAPDEATDAPASVAEPLPDELALCDVCEPSCAEAIARVTASLYDQPWPSGWTVAVEPRVVGPERDLVEVDWTRRLGARPTRLDPTAPESDEVVVDGPLPDLRGDVLYAGRAGLLFICDEAAPPRTRLAALVEGVARTLRAPHPLDDYSTPGVWLSRQAASVGVGHALLWAVEAIADGSEAPWRSAPDAAGLRAVAFDPDHTPGRSGWRDALAVDALDHVWRGRARLGWGALDVSLAERPPDCTRALTKGGGTCAAPTLPAVAKIGEFRGARHVLMPPHYLEETLREAGVDARVLEGYAGGVGRLWLRLSDEAVARQDRLVCDDEAAAEALAAALATLPGDTEMVIRVDGFEVLVAQVPDGVDAEPFLDGLVTP